ncbi:MAG: UDP-N-acetylglucosamine 1-carboxyvinyltransferase [Bacilli bacterium]|nr:UDP-N-acetylglucosamine 1-carboxyvinyltransferase [Bacilli bacterium]
MDKIKVIGEQILSGKIHISGSKNSVVSLIPAAILSDNVVIEKVPNISDVKNLELILDYLNVSYKFDNDSLFINTSDMINKDITSFYSTKLRASYYFMGALLGKYKKVRISLPGGCEIGRRAFDFHLKGFEKMGATIDTSEKDIFEIKADRLVGADIHLPFPSVGATVNLLLAAVLAEGETTINNAASEPEIGNLIEFLISMGAKIEGKDTNYLRIEGVSNLSGGSIKVIPDRIEAGTYILAGIMNGDNLEICDIRPDHLTSFFDKLSEMGASFEIKENSVITNKSIHLKPVNIVTEVYPGFATDLQQPITTLLLMCNGVSTVKETIYENRFQNTKYLNEMGADIKVDGDTIYVNGPTKLNGKVVRTSDLRAGAALILAALSAHGETTITDIRHLLRGYSDLISKLSNVGAKIWLENE